MTRTVLLRDVASISKTSISPFKEPDTIFKVFSIPGYDANKPELLSGSKILSNKFTLDKPSILISKLNPRIHRVWKIENPPENAVCSTEFVVVQPKKIEDVDYLYAVASSTMFQDHLLQRVKGTSGSHQRVKPEDLLTFNLPNTSNPKFIGDFVKNIDEKIELNRKMNETLEQMGQALFRHYFIDNPEAEKWEEGVLGDIIINSDSKRKPLSSRQRADMQGEYRYFGATSVMDYVNDYLFDGTYLLLAEDGSVIKADGTPYLQYIWGKFWVNNHAHILQAKMPFTVEYLYLLLSQANVQSLISGAVQLKINQKAMNSFKIKLPPNELVNSFCEKIDPMFAQRRKNEEQIQTLTTLRDTLLPRLINGKLKI